MREGDNCSVSSLRATSVESWSAACWLSSASSSSWWWWWWWWCSLTSGLIRPHVIMCDMLHSSHGHLNTHHTDRWTPLFSDSPSVSLIFHHTNNVSENCCIVICVRWTTHKHILEGNTANIQHPFIHESADQKRIRPVNDFPDWSAFSYNTIDLHVPKRWLGTSLIYYNKPKSKENVMK